MCEGRGVYPEFVMNNLSFSGVNKHNLFYRFDFSRLFMVLIKCHLMVDTSTDHLQQISNLKIQNKTDSRISRSKIL